MAVKNLSLLVALVLSGCNTFASIDDLVGFEDKNNLENTVSLDENAKETDFFQNVGDESALASSVNFQRQFQEKFEQKDSLVTMKKLKEILIKQNISPSYKDYDINHYVRGLMQDLVANLQYVNATTPVAIVSFVMLDSDYNDSNLLGIQIAESLIHEVHKFGIPVIDFKTTGFIRITEQGDFAFSKDYEDFSGDMPARYIVGGTMLKHTDGYLINARIVGVTSQAVVASAQSFIPNSVSDPILRMAAAPKSRTLNKNVELGSVAYPLDYDLSLVAQKNENLMDQGQSMNNIANNASSNSVSLIQE
jgi:TolB-like protein|tara:strand:- start:45 stop:962 length:918 start_codon:yes stop_codon:yes gene_type:complete